VGQVHEGVVTDLVALGAFVELALGAKGQLHISELGLARAFAAEDTKGVGQRVRTGGLQTHAAG